MELTLTTIFALAGMGLIIVAIFGGGIQVKEIKIPPLSNSIRIMSAIVGVGLLVAAYYLSLPTTSTKPLPPTSHVAVATFEYPARNAEIPIKTELRGTVTPAVPNRGSYWIVMRDDDGDYYPQAKIAASQNGTWTHSLALGLAWKGRPAWVLLTFARNEQADKHLSQSLNEGLSKLPDNVVVLNTLLLRVQQ